MNKCGKCGKRGHNRTTCSSKIRKVKKSKTRKMSTGSKTVSRLGRKLHGSSGRWTVLYHGGRTRGVEHDKSWAVKVAKKGSGYVVVTRWGRRTGQKNETTSRVMTRESANNKMINLIKSKLRKGYIGAGFFSL